MTNKTRIVAAVVDTTACTLYKADGSTISILQGDPRLKFVLDQAIPQLEANKSPQGMTWADVVLDLPVENSYADFEQKSSGVVKFFRMAKTKLKEILGMQSEPVMSMKLGTVPRHDAPSQPADAEPEAVADAPASSAMEAAPAQESKTMSVVDEIIKHAVPVQHEDFHERDIDKQAPITEAGGDTPGKHVEEKGTHTIVAVVGGKVVPGVEKIKNQFAHAAKMGSTVGVENFLRRLGAVIDKRRHSVEDLLKFMERNDMPIADDGSIIIYKRLQSSGPDKFVDCHTRKVEQWVGCYVCMDESLVDPNRRNECSNGLHVARRGYIGGFSGNVIVMAKLDPEDVIAVPEYDANKMRVCGYHIVHQVSDAQFKLLCANKPFTDDPEGKALLAAVIAGKHIDRTHEVRITQQQGGGVLTKPYVYEQSKPEFEPVATVPAAEAPKEVEALPNHIEEVKAALVVPTEVVKQVEQVQAMSKKDQAKVLYDAWNKAKGAEKDRALVALVAFKKAAKKGWDVLGIPDPTAAKPQPAKAKPEQKAKATAATVKVIHTKTVAKVQAKQVEQVQLDGEQDRRGLDLSDEGTDQKDTPRTRIAKLLSLGDPTPDVAAKILAIKKAAKKSWDILNVSPDMVDTIMKLTGNGSQKP